MQEAQAKLEAELQSTSAQNRALTGELEKMQETQTKSETTISELQKQLLILEAELQSTSDQNRALTEEKEKAQGMRTEFETTISKLRTRILSFMAELRSASTQNPLKGEATNCRCMATTRGVEDTQALEAPDLEFSQAKATLQQDLEKMTKEAKDWKDLCEHYRKTPSQTRAIQRGDNVPVSVAGIIAEKDQTIKNLSDRLSECYALLTQTGTLDSDPKAVMLRQ
jgi:chromosome segregation ATPase